MDEQENLDAFELRIGTAESSRNAVEIFSTMAAHEQGLLKRTPPPTSLATGRLMLAETTREHVAIAIHNLSVGLRRLSRITGTVEGQQEIRAQWLQLKQLAGWLNIELEGPPP